MLRTHVGESREALDIDLDVVWQVIDRDAVLLEALLADLSRDLHAESDRGLGSGRAGDEPV